LLFLGWFVLFVFLLVFCFFGLLFKFACSLFCFVPQRDTNRQPAAKEIEDEAATTTEIEDEWRTFHYLALFLVGLFCLFVFLLGCWLTLFCWLTLSFVG